MFSEPSQIGARDVRFIQLVHDLVASKSARFIKQRNARNEAELLPLFGALTETRPGTLR